MRVENWAGILAGEIEKAESEPFEWGVNDCCLWVSSVVKAFTGVDYALGFRDSYTTEAEATAIIKGMGDDGTLLSAVRFLLSDLEEMNINFAQRGDIVLATIAGNQTIGIATGSGIAFKTFDGLIRLPRSKCDIAWRVK